MPRIRCWAKVVPRDSLWARQSIPTWLTLRLMSPVKTLVETDKWAMLPPLSNHSAQIFRWSILYPKLIKFSVKVIPRSSGWQMPSSTWLQSWISRLKYLTSLEVICSWSGAPVMTMPKWEMKIRGAVTFLMPGRIYVRSKMELKCLKVSSRKSKDYFHLRTNIDEYLSNTGYRDDLDHLRLKSVSSVKWVRYPKSSATLWALPS